MKIFHYHFCANRGSIFVYHFHVSRSTVMHTFGIILVLLLEHHVVLFAYINLLIVYTKIDNNLV
jgi:hypothetical protein